MDIKQKFQITKIKILSWYNGLPKGKRIAFTIGTATLAVAILAFIGYGCYSYWYWNIKSSDWSKLFPSTEDLNVAPTQKRDQPAPLNGVYYSKEQADIFMNRKPLAILVNNHVQARPHYGLSKADLVYEAVAEGGITRFLAFFHAQDVDQVGPVRSARVYHLDWAAEVNSWFAHWGGSYMDADDKANIDNPNYNFTCDPEADSYAYINELGVPSLDRAWLGDTAYWRDNSRNVAMEHTGYTSTQKLWHEAPNRYPEPGWREFRDFERWLFKVDAEEFERGPAGKLNIDFWQGYSDYHVIWEYDPSTNLYTRYQGGELQVDAGNSDAPLEAKNIVVQFIEQSFFNDRKNHIRYKTTGTGTALVYLDGKEIQAEWHKESPRERTIFYYAHTSDPIEFNRGQIWVEAVPAGSAVSYE